MVNTSARTVQTSFVYHFIVMISLIAIVGGYNAAMLRKISWLETIWWECVRSNNLWLEHSSKCQWKVKN